MLKMYAFAASLVVGLVLMFQVGPPFGFKVYLFVSFWVGIKYVMEAKIGFVLCLLGFEIGFFLLVVSLGF